MRQPKFAYPRSRSTEYYGKFSFGQPCLIDFLEAELRGSEFWTKGYFISSVGKHGDEKKLRNYVKNQGSHSSSYEAFHTNQLKLF